MSESTENVPMRERRRQVRAFRKEKGLTLAKLGERVGLSESALHRFENGKRGISVEKWSKLQRVMFEGEGHGLQRRFDSREFADVALELEIISWLQKNINGSVCPKTKTWLAAEMDAALARQRAMELAELAYEENGIQKPGAITLLPVRTTESGDSPAFPVSPIEDRPAPLRRLALPKPENFQACLVWNREQEENLKAEGWQEVKSE